MTNRPISRVGERTFLELLYDWMERAPWLAISAAAHLLLYFLLSAIPWDQLRREEPPVLLASIASPPLELVDELPEPVEPVAPVEPSEPVAQSAEPVDAPVEADPGDVDDASLDPFSGDVELVAGTLPELGFGGGPPAGSKLGNRIGRRGLPQGSPSEAALEAALTWLAAHQARDGSWNCDGFMASCGKIGATTCDGPGAATHDVGVTALALLAFLGDGNTTDRGEHRDVVARGIAWLKEQQDPDTGLLGERASHDFLYDHALGTLALCEAYYFTQSPLIKGTAQKAVNLIFTARSPYGAWRYDLPPVGDSDTSVTGWMVFALASARDAGLVGDFEGAFDGALSFLDEVTDPTSGRVGYSTLGELSSRTPANEHHPREKGEAMTAVGLLCRIFLGQRPEDAPILAKHAELVRSKPPVWDPDGFGSDMYYWYYGTYALYQMGRPWWPAWEKAMRPAIVGSQRQDGDEQGSWDPICAWGYSGGRVYSTALMTLCIEVYYRYARVLGAR